MLCSPLTFMTILISSAVFAQNRVLYSRSGRPPTRIDIQDVDRPPTGNPVGHFISDRSRYVREREPHPVPVRRTATHRVWEAVHGEEVEAEAARVPHGKRSLAQIIGKPTRHILRALQAPLAG
jgi:hypothetical protein